MSRTHDCQQGDLHLGLFLPPGICRTGRETSNMKTVLLGKTVALRDEKLLVQMVDLGIVTRASDNPVLHRPSSRYSGEVG